jgi:fibronectin type 3 domain-containing protein
MYYYYVTAVDNKSNDSPYLCFVGARPRDTRAPSVADLELRAEEVLVGNALFLIWSWEEQEPPDPDVCGYNLYRSTSYDGIYRRINVESITGMVYEDTNLTDGAEYFYKITALDEVPNESGYVGPISGNILGC